MDINQAQTDIQNFADYLLQLSPEEMTLLAFSLAYILAHPLTVNQQNTIGNFVILFGQVFLTMNAQQVYINNTHTHHQ